MKRALFYLLQSVFLLFLTVIFFAALSFSSCDLLRVSPFEVSSWSPGEGYCSAPDAAILSLEFSHDPDRASVEKNFNVQEDGSRLKGALRWEGRKLVFMPLSPLEINRDYSINVSADAHDQNGLSLDAAFEGRFSTRPSETRPVLRSVFPAANETITDLRQEVRLLFSMEVPLPSLRENVSFSPPMTGSWHYENDEAVFTPAEPWEHGKRYELRVSESLFGINGVSMGREKISAFIVGIDHEKPCLTGVWRVTEDGSHETLEENVLGGGVENSGWEKEDKLLLVFSKPVDLLSVKNCMEVQGTSLPVLLSRQGFSDEALFGFDQAPAFDSRFSVTVRKGIRDSSGNESEEAYVFKILADGQSSRPPSLYGVRIPMAPGNAVDFETKSYRCTDLFADLPIVGGAGRYPYNYETETWIELFFETASGAVIDQFSLMELFRVNTSNNVLIFSPRKIIGENFSVPEPEPGWENFQRLEIQGFLTNTVNSGVVNIEIAGGLRDSKKNRNENSFRISLLK